MRWLVVQYEEHCVIELRLPVSSPSFACAGLKRFLKKNAEGDTLAVMDSKLGSIIKEKLGISCTYRFAHTCKYCHWGCMSLKHQVLSHTEFCQL